MKARLTLLHKVANMEVEIDAGDKHIQADRFLDTPTPTLFKYHQERVLLPENN